MSQFDYIKDIANEHKSSEHIYYLPSVTKKINLKRIDYLFENNLYDLPDKKRIAELSQFVKQFGIRLDPENKRSIQKMLQEIEGRTEEFLINDITIRAMSKAIYSEENIGQRLGCFSFSDTGWSQKEK